MWHYWCHLVSGFSWNMYVKCHLNRKWKKILWVCWGLENISSETLLAIIGKQAWMGCEYEWDSNWCVMTTGPLLAWIQKLTVQHFTLEVENLFDEPKLLPMIATNVYSSLYLKKCVDISNTRHSIPVIIKWSWYIEYLVDSGRFR